MLPRKAVALRRAVALLTATTVGLFYLLSKPSQFGDWSQLDITTYRPYPHKSHHAPQQPLADNLQHPPSPNAAASEPKAESTPPTPPHRESASVCAGFPDTSRIMVVMKTGASESFARVPTQLMTMLKCLPDFLIFSDMDQDIAGYHIMDSLDEVPMLVAEGNPDFDLYRRQKACLVDLENCNKLGNPASEGWKLDKYKNVHIAEKTYTMRPGYDWYLFVDADTYVLFPNLVRWLSMMDPTRKRYLGSVTLLNDFGFGHGGSGYVVSKAAMEDMVGRNPGIGGQYDGRAAKECCGDYVFGMAMKEKADVVVEQMWPTINGEKPSTLPFGPSHWCHPIVTMHHLNSEEIDGFWKFENHWYRVQKANPPSRPLLIKDIYHQYLKPRIEARRANWDNLSDDRFYLAMDGTREYEDWMLGRVKNCTEYNSYEKKAHLSLDDCEAACQSLPSNECFQFKYENGLCAFSSSIKLGKPVKNEDNELKRTASGWDVDKIHQWILKQGSCSKIHWPGVGK